MTSKRKATTAAGSWYCLECGKRLTAAVVKLNEGCVCGSGDVDLFENAAAHKAEMIRLDAAEAAWRAGRGPKPAWINDDGAPEHVAACLRDPFTGPDADCLACLSAARRS